MKQYREPENGTEAVAGEYKPFVVLPKFDNICEGYNPKIKEAHTWSHQVLAIAAWTNRIKKKCVFFLVLHLLSEAYDWFTNLQEVVAKPFQ